MQQKLTNYAMYKLIQNHISDGPRRHATHIQMIPVIYRPTHSTSNRVSYSKHAQSWYTPIWRHQQHQDCIIILACKKTQPDVEEQGLHRIYTGSA